MRTRNITINIIDTYLFANYRQPTSFGITHFYYYDRQT
jgi:hypothetical protein